MEMTFSAVVSALTEYTPVASSALVIHSNPSRVVSLYDYLDATVETHKENYVYLGKASSLQGPWPGSNFLVWEDAPLNRTELASGNANVVLVSTEEEYIQLKHALMTLFEDQNRLTTFNSQLLDLVQDGAKPQRILDLASVFLGNPVLLLDPLLSLLASSGTSNVSNDSTVAYVLQNGIMPESYIEEVLREQDSGDSDDKVLVIWEKTFLDHRMVAGRIMLGDRLLGYLKVFETGKPFAPYFDPELLKLACRYLAIRMNSTAGPTTGDPQIESFLLGMIEHRFTDSEQIARRVEQLGLELRARLVAIVVQFEETFRNRDKLPLLKKRLQNYFNRNTALIVGDQVVLLYDRDTWQEMFAPQRMAYMQRFLEENHCRAAYSIPFRNIGDFYKYYMYAISCFSVAEQCRIGDRILLYEDFKIDHMLLQFSNVLNLSDLVHPAIIRLMEIDADKGSDLTQTLFEFLRNRQDMTMTAKSVQIHYNSLKYRINRIQELTGINFDDSEAVFKMLLSEKVLRLQACLHPEESRELPPVDLSRRPKSDKHRQD
ncbi:MAG: helix-turn-helix domain-containing protein [Propionibacteriaceae bacterium]|jgi:hypothetical protein|nr:helix-turn-helix domain-containing protein [Propionibacteriaceae bacterium]